MRIFSKDSLLNRITDTLGHLTILNLTFVLFSLPLVTLPAALTALNACTLCLARKEEYQITRFFQRFKSDFKVSFQVGLALVGLAAALSADHYLLTGVMADAPRAAIYILYGLIALAAGMAVYIFPLIARFENRWYQYFRLALLMAVGNPFKTILMASLTAMPIVLCLQSPGLFIRVLPIWLLFGFSLTAYFNARLLRWIFSRFESGQEEEAPE